MILSFEVFFFIQSGILFCLTVCQIVFCIEIHWEKKKFNLDLFETWKQKTKDYPKNSDNCSPKAKQKKKQLWPGSFM